MTTTDFSLKLLGKSLTEITLNDLTEFFKTGRDESDIFELKSFDQRNTNYKDKENAILKTICAFLNSNGGLLVWGAPIGEKTNNNQKVFKGDLSPVGKLIEKDAFINKITTRIIPIPPKVNFHPVEVEKDKFVYLFEIQESITKPHQFDSRYFMRLDGQTRVAPHHYIEALFKQIKYPNIEGYIEFLSEYQIDRNYLQIPISIIVENLTPFQNEENVSFVFNTNKGKFRDDTGRNDNFKNVRFDNNLTQAVSNNFKEVLHYGLIEKFIIYLTFETRKIRNEYLTVDLSLSVGGRFSPLKISKYKLSIYLDSQDKLDIQNQTLQYNILAYDY